MNQLASTKAASVWSFFADICEIPHPSKHEEKIRSWITDWAKKNKIHCVQDAIGNLILKKAASAGKESCTPIILQAHLDMVPQKNNDTDHDFLVDPILTEIKGDWMHAKSTTLGADNGIGMAACLAVLADNTLVHGPLEVLLTTDEETGMTGAFGLEEGALEGKILINTDSEDEGELYVGCAGGVNVNVTTPFEIMEADPKSIALEISLTGLKGGHSGCDINLNRGNAIKLVAAALANLDVNQYQLANIVGGSLRNAIPREASAIIVCDAEYKNSIEVLISHLNIEFRNKLTESEPNLHLAVNQVCLPHAILTTQSKENIINAINLCENGIYSMDENYADVVQTSSNFGVLLQDNEAQAFKIQVLVRSQVEAEKNETAQKIQAHFSAYQSTINIAGDYPGWAPNSDSAIYRVMQAEYVKLFDKTPKTMVIHAGLECGLFSKKYPDWDMISFGPTIMFPHSPDEKVNIPTVDKFWQLLVATLSAID